MNAWVAGHVIYPLHERLMGRKTFACYRQLMQSQWWPAERLRQLQLDKLRARVAAAMKTPAYAELTGLPSGYTVGSAASPAYLSPITFTGTATNNNVNVVLANGTVQTGQGYSPGPLGSNPYSQTILNGPINYNVDLSVFKVFPITESTYLRFNVDAFNALNIQGYQNPNGTTGEILYAPGAVGASSYWSARQIQLTLRLQF